MAGDKRRKITYELDETSQEVDLEKLLGRKPNRVENELFVNLAIETIIGRTQSGVDINGRDFADYSEKYAQKKGVDESDVDMTLLGDMLLSIKRFKGREKLTFGIDNDKEAKKSFNHNTGDTLKKRTFFGLTKGEQERIAKLIKEREEKPRTVKEAKKERELSLRDAIESIVIRNED